MLLGQENADQVTEAPPEPVKFPVGTPPTVTPVNAVAAVALPKSVLLRVTVPLMSTSPVIAVAFAEATRLKPVAAQAKYLKMLFFIVLLLFVVGYFCSTV